jgi:predicted RND superfamily exporter protein
MTISERMARHVLKNRLFYLLATLGITAAFIAMIPRVKVESPLIDLFPSDHEFVETYKEFQDVFGGANTVIMAVEVKDGDIFDAATLGKIRSLTKELELLDGINNYQVLSLAQRKVKNITVDQGMFKATPMMWPKIPETADDIQRLKDLVHTNARVHGALVARDDKAALILAGFFENKMDVKEVYGRLHELGSKIEDGNTRVHIIGRPVMLGFIRNHMPQLSYLFVATILAMLVILAFNFRNLRGVLIPTITAVLSAIWGVGFLGLMGYNFDPLVLVVPFIISARALSHSVQLIERYNEEYVDTGDVRVAAEKTFASLWEPGFVGIVADVLAMLAVLFTPIPLMQKLSIMSAFWGLSIVVTDLVFNPVLLSYLPPPKKMPSKDWGPLGRFLANVGRLCIGPRKWTILAGTAVAGVLGFMGARIVQIGDVYPGTPMLWPDSQYNQDTEAIGARFGNTDILNVIVEGQAWNAVKSPEVLEKMHLLQREMSQMPEVGGTSSIGDLLPTIIRAMHGGDPRWELVPNNGSEAGAFLEMIIGASEPGDLTRFITPDNRNANIAIYLKDHRGETLRTVVAKLREFVAANPMTMADPKALAAAQECERNAKTDSDEDEDDTGSLSAKSECPNVEPGARFRLAGGFAGLLAAVNEVVLGTEIYVTLTAFFLVFLICAISYRSILAGLFFMLPLVVSNYLTYGLMGLRGIGLDVNTLPIVALGVGLGVDYGLYVVSRIEEEFRTSGDLADAIITAMATSGKAVVMTAMTMVAGVIFWTFSFLRFQADMGLLLVFWMSMSMVGSLLLLPTLIWIFRPKFVFRARADVEKAVVAAAQP